MCIRDRVSPNLGLTADPGPPAAVPAAHQVPEFPFDLGSGGPVLGPPRRVLLGGPGPGQLAFVGADPDGAPGLPGRALGSQRATGAGGLEGRRWYRGLRDLSLIHIS